MSRFLTIVTVSLFSIAPVLAQQTPPVMPRVQETPLPPVVQIGPPSSVPADVPNAPLTADEAVRIALRHQPSLTVAASGVTAAQGRQEQARSGLFPSLGLSASYNNVSGTPSGTTDTTGQSSSGGYRAGATVRQLIFDFSHTRALTRQTGALTASAQANLTRAQSDLALQVKQGFYTFVQNQRLVGVNEANLRNQQSHLALACARVNAGVGLPADVVRAETAVADAILSLNLARTSSTTSQINLALFMGIDPRTPIRTAESGEPARSENDMNALVDLALKRRPEILQAQANIRAASFGVSAARTSNAPSVAASLGWNARGSNFPPGDDSVSVGVTLQFTPFDSGLTAGRVKEAKAGLVSSQAQMDSTRLSVISDVSQAYLSVKTAEQRVVTADAEVANAVESVRLAQGRYSAGLGTFLDVLDAQAALVTAQTNRVNAASTLDQARASLAHSTYSDLGGTT